MLKYVQGAIVFKKLAAATRSTLLLVCTRWTSPRTSYVAYCSVVAVNCASSPKESIKIISSKGYRGVDTPDPDP